MAPIAATTTPVMLIVALAPGLFCSAWTSPIRSRANINWLGTTYSSSDEGRWPQDKQFSLHVSTQQEDQRKQTNIAEPYTVRKVATDEDVMNVASFRNGRVNPMMMIENQAAARERNAANPMQTVGRGIGIGVGIGVVTGAMSLVNGDTMAALQNSVVVGGSLAVLLTANNMMNQGVYVMNKDEAENRLLVDFAEGLKKKQDWGFVAVLEDGKNERFQGCQGVMAAVDAQLRNSVENASSIEYMRTVGNLPPHLHIKNMFVDETMRRRGIGRALLQAIEEYALASTDVQWLTLEVEEKNMVAVKLYESFGFVAPEEGAPSGYSSFMSGRTFMKKVIR